MFMLSLLKHIFINCLSQKKHIDEIFGDTFRMLRNLRMAFQFQNKIMRKIIATMIRPKLEYRPTQEKTCIEFIKNTENNN